MRVWLETRLVGLRWRWCNRRDPKVRDARLGKGLIVGFLGAYGSSFVMWPSGADARLAEYGWMLAFWAIGATIYFVTEIYGELSARIVVQSKRRPGS
jgi:hypothetical protein